MQILCDKTKTFWVEGAHLEKKLKKIVWQGTDHQIKIDPTVL